MRSRFNALLVPALAVLMLVACKPAAEVDPEVHATEASSEGHDADPADTVVTMEQAVADARAAAEAPSAQPTPTQPAPTASENPADASETTPPASQQTQTGMATPAASEAPAPAAHASGH